MDEIQDLDLLREDNDLLSSSSHSLLHHHFSEHKQEQEDKMFDLSEHEEVLTLCDTTENIQQSEILLQPSESVEPVRVRKHGKCNLRKSLAWDKAFFTSEGFLEPEELSSMLEEADKRKKSVLPAIEEDDMQRSLDSISTLESDSLTLESIEADLFQDIRASIQRSSKVSSATSINNQAIAVEKQVQTIQPSRTAVCASQIKVLPKLIPKRPSINAAASGRTMRKSICQQVTQSPGKGGVSGPSHPKLPKALGRAIPMSTAAAKRASVGPNRIKLEKDNSKISAVAGRLAPLSRAPDFGGSHGGVPRQSQTLKLSSSGSSTTTKIGPRTSCSSIDSSDSVSSRTVCKSTSNSMKRMPDSKAVKPPSSGPNIASRNKTQQSNSQLSSYIKSASKLSCSTSPASSISEWSCESSSSTTTTKQRISNGKDNLGSSSPSKGVYGDSIFAQTSLPQSNVHFSMEHGIQATGFQSQFLKVAVMETGASASQPSAKPSGLRMPSPKIGFFDGVKSVARTPKGGMQSQSHVQSSLRKSGLGSFSPSVTKAVRNCPGLSPEFENLKSKSGGTSRLKTEEESALRLDRARYDPDSCSKSKLSLAIQESVQSKNIESSLLKVQENNEFGDNALYDQNYSKNSSTSSSNTDEDFVNQNDGAGCRKEAMNLNDEMKGLEHISVSHSNVKYPDNNNSSELSCLKEIYGCKTMEDESSNILSYPALVSGFPVTSELTVDPRIPFAENNSLSDQDRPLEFSKGLTVDSVEKTDILLSLESTEKENT